MFRSRRSRMAVAFFALLLLVGSVVGGIVIARELKSAKRARNNADKATEDAAKAQAAADEDPGNEAKQKNADNKNKNAQKTQEQANAKEQKEQQGRSPDGDTDDAQFVIPVIIFMGGVGFLLIRQWDHYFTTFVPFYSSSQAVKEKVRDDIEQAEAVEEEWGEFKAGPSVPTSGAYI